MANDKKISKKMQEILSDKEYMDAMSWIFSDERMPHLKDPYEGISGTLAQLKGLDPSSYQHLLDRDDATQEDLDRWHMINWLQSQRIRRSHGYGYDREGKRLPGGSGTPPSDRKPGESVKLRRIEDKVMDDFIEADSKYNMGE